MPSILFLVCLCWLLLPGVPRAADVAGEDDPRFQAALELWLADDDQAALPALAALAGEGNRAAQVLLALADAITPLQGPWLAGLPRAERIALMRQPGGLSGRSWMEAAAADTPLAAAWFALWRGTDRDEIEIARAFAAMGEDRAVYETLIVMSLGDRRGIAALADEPDLSALAAVPRLARVGGRSGRRAAHRRGGRRAAAGRSADRGRHRPAGRRGGARGLAGRGSAGRAAARLLRRRVPREPAGLRRCRLRVSRQKPRARGVRQSGGKPDLLGALGGEPARPRDGAPPDLAGRSGPPRAHARRDRRAGRLLRRSAGGGSRALRRLIARRGRASE